MYSGGSGLSIDIHFVDIELSYDVLSPLPTLLSKHFNHPHPYIEIATAISDTLGLTGQGGRQQQAGRAGSTTKNVIQYRLRKFVLILLCGHSLPSYY